MTAPDPNAAAKGCDALLRQCGRLQPHEHALILCDSATQPLAQMLADHAAADNPDTELHQLPDMTMHGSEPPDTVAERMLHADVIFCLTSMSLAHSRARQAATARGTRFLSLPDYDWSVLASPALQVDFQALEARAAALTQALDAATSAHVTSAAGTDLRLDLTGRRANCCPGFCGAPGSLASPPDSEANIAPLEDRSEGILVVDGSIPCRQLGKLDMPLRVTIEAGTIIAVEGTHAETLSTLLDSLGNPRTRILAELGIGLNPQARLTGKMLEDEGVAGTIHCGFGSNATIGGTNAIPFHLDMVVLRPSLTLDTQLVLHDGDFHIP